MAKKSKQGRKFVREEGTTDGTLGSVKQKRIPAAFFRMEAGNEPVRDFLKSMAPADRRLIGQDIQTVEFGWPLGMPTCRPLGDGLHEVRTMLEGNRIARVFFYVDRNQRMILLHAILKKTRATPASDLDLARQNKRKHEKALE
jgi:phage-related protein